MISVKELCRRVALGLFLVTLAATVTAAQSKPSTQIGGKPTEAKPPVAQYDIGQIVKRLAALEGQVSQVKQENAGLTAQIKKMQVVIGSMNLASTTSAASANKVTAEL